MTTSGRTRPTGERQLAAWLMSGPALLGLLLFMVLPFAVAIGLSLTDARLGSPLPTRWVGLAHYRRLLGDEAFLRALANNAMFALVVVPLQTALALALALALDLRLRGIAVLRACFFMPVVYPMALVSAIWLMLYAPGAEGPVNRILGILSLGAWAPGPAEGVLTHPLTALPAIMLLSIWQGLGFQTVILLAGLQGLPRELFEAAALDGAGRWCRLRHIILPGLRGPIAFTALITTILAFRLFDQVRIMTAGGPGNATTTVMFQTVRAAYDRQQVGLGSAMTVIFFVIVCTLSLIQLWLLRRRTTS